jgi:hypothetical protein
MAAAPTAIVGAQCGQKYWHWQRYADIAAKKCIHVNCVVATAAAVTAGVEAQCSQTSLLWLTQAAMVANAVFDRSSSSIMAQTAAL